MSLQVTTFRLKFTPYLNWANSKLAANILDAKRHLEPGKVFKFFIGEDADKLLDPANFSECRNPSYVAAAQARALMQPQGGFYLQDEEVFLKINCGRAADLNSAYSVYRSRGLPIEMFPQENLDENAKSYHSIRSLKPLVFTPSYQLGSVKDASEPLFKRALQQNNIVAKSILIHCLPGIEIECPFYVMFKSFTVKFGSADENDSTSDLYYDVISDKIIESGGKMNLPISTDKYYFLKRDFLLKTGKFPRFQDVHRHLVFMKPNKNCLFISHDWQTPVCPDPENQQFDELKQIFDKGTMIDFYAQKVSYHIGDKIFIKYLPLEINSMAVSKFNYLWYDYSCLPQKPRSDDDEVIFREQIGRLNQIFINGMKTIQIGNKEKQRSRSWCLIEQELSRIHDGINMPFQEMPDLPMAYANVDTIFHSVNSIFRDSKVTEPEDRRIIEWMYYKSITDNFSDMSIYNIRMNQKDYDKLSKYFGNRLLRYVTMHFGNIFLKFFGKGLIRKGRIFKN